MGTMSSYTLPQWIIFFFIYCFVGWVWECCYVSVRMRKWTNRGFMHGPFLPIYGSGAIAILFTTFPVRSIPVLVFVVSVVTATVLELCTGLAMESLFKVRYWDYTRYKLNYKGYICLPASLAWGVGGTLLVLVVNKPIEHVVCNVIPTTVAELLSFALTVCASCDFGASFKEAMDIRDFIVRLSEEKDRQLRRLEKRVDVFAAVYGDELEKGVEKAQQATSEAIDKIVDIKDNSQEFFKEKLETLSDKQRKLLNRFINANPDAHSSYTTIAELLGTLKKQKDLLAKRITRTNDND